MADVVGAARLEAWASRNFWTDLTVAQRQDLRELLTAHGWPNGDDILAAEYDLIDAPLLRLTVIERDERGRAYADEHDEIARRVVEIPLRTQLPEWWRP